MIKEIFISPEPRNINNIENNSVHIGNIQEAKNSNILTTLWLSPIKKGKITLTVEHGNKKDGTDFTKTKFYKNTEKETDRYIILSDTTNNINKISPMYQDRQDFEVPDVYHFKYCSEKKYMRIILKSESISPLVTFSFNYHKIKKKSDELYLPMRQGSLTNSLSRMSGKCVKANMYDELIIEHKDVKVLIEKYKESSAVLKTSTMQLLDVLVALMTRDNKKNIKLKITDLMELKGLKDKKGLMRTTHSDLNILRKMWITFNKKTNGGTTVLQSKEIKRGYVNVIFSDIFFEITSKYSKMPLLKGLLSIDCQKFPHGYVIGRKMLEHHYMNINKPNAGIISIDTVLDSLLTLPKINKVRKNKHSWRERILNPLIKNLDGLPQSITWKFNQKKFGTYEDFVNSNILFKVKGYSDWPLLLKAKRAKIITSKRNK